MSKKYEGFAQQIVDRVGGKANISDVYHCQTRLRFKLVDESKADQKGLEDLNGVTKVLIKCRCFFRLLLVTHVAEVFEEIEKFVDIKSNKTQQESEKKRNRNYCY